MSGNDSASGEDGVRVGEGDTTVGSAGRSRRGFASMDPAKQREIASRGGLSAHAKGVAHQFTSDEARAAGRKGGAATSANRQHMAEIGRVGGRVKGRRQDGAS